MAEMPLVSIVCIAFNQEKFIGQALQSFLRQETDFPWELIVNDDASPDGTAEVIRSFEPQFGGRLRALYQAQNQWSQGVHPWFDVTFPQVRGKYIALCEGDDYWVDPKKLQKQVDFLEAHPDHGAIHSDYLELHEASGVHLHLRREAFIKSGDIFRDMLNANTNYLSTGSLVLRTELVRDAVAAIQKMPKFAMGDFPLVLYIASRSKIAYLDEVTCVYRVLEESASHSRNAEKIIAFRRSTLDVIETFAQLLPEPEDIVSHAREFFHSALLVDCLRHPAIAAKFLPELDTRVFRGGSRWKHNLCRWLQGGLLAQILARFLTWRDAHRQKQMWKVLIVPAPTVHL